MQGLNGADDFLHNKFPFMMLQETKIQKNVQINMESSNGQKLTPLVIAVDYGKVLEFSLVKTQKSVSKLCLKEFAC